MVDGELKSASEYASQLAEVVECEEDACKDLRLRLQQIEEWWYGDSM